MHVLCQTTAAVGRECRHPGDSLKSVDLRREEAEPETRALATVAKRRRYSQPSLPSRSTSTGIRPFTSRTRRSASRIRST